MDNEKVIGNKNFLIVLLLCLMFLDWSGYGYYIFYLSFIYFIFKKGFRQIDSNFKLLLLFGLSYSIIDILNVGSISYAYNILPIINFPMVYLMGKMIADDNTYNNQISTIWIFAIAMALLTMLSTYVSFLEDGFALVGRDIKLIGYSNRSGDVLYSATGLYSKILPLTLFTSFLFISEDRKIRWLYFASAILAFVCCLRLQSRSAIYVTTIAIVIPFLFGGKGNLVNKIIGAAVIFCVISYVLSHFSDDLMIIDRFQNNNAFDNEGQDSRMDLSVKTLQDLLTHPFGGLKMNRYAHNLWIDCARVSGWIPASILIVITLKWIKTTIQIYRYKKIDYYYRLFIFVASICLFMYFNTEPIIEGAAMLFTFFCLYLGMINKTLKKNKLR